MAAFSRSAVAVTIVGFLPPISVMIGLGCVREDLAHRVLVPLVPRHLRGIPPQEVRGLIDVRHRFIAVLPVLEGQQGRVCVLPFGDSIRRPLDGPYSFQVRGRGPRWECRLRGLDRLHGVRSGPFLEETEYETCIGGGYARGRRGGPHLLSLRWKWMGVFVHCPAPVLPGPPIC